MSRILVRVAVLAGGMVAVLCGLPLQAHHSVAAYDRDHPLTLSGTVREFKLTNPHTHIYLIVPDGHGGERQWDLLGGTADVVIRMGWTTRTLQPGMKIRILVAPRKDGTDTGEWQRLLEVNGQPFAQRLP